jgi:non-ribosomal peptide synthetase-like protein
MAPLLTALYLTWLHAHSVMWTALGVLVAAVPVGVAITCLFVAALKRLVLPRAAAGVMRIDSFLYVRKWLSDGIMAACRSTLLPLYTTLYLPPWLRLLGARIGRRAELSTVWHFAPELIEVGEESFFADGSIIGGRRSHRGLCQLGKNRIGRRSFVGNSAILPVGASLGNGCLLGVQSLPPRSPSGAGSGAGAGTTPDGSEWLGSPSFALTYRPRIGNFDEEVTYHPTPKLYAQRAVIDALRILIPGYIGLAGFVGTIFLYNLILTHAGLGPLVALAPVLAIGFGLVSMLIVAGLKWAVMGTFKPIIKPLWSMYVWLNEMINGAYESVMAPALNAYLGTPFAAPLLRLLGCRIGRRTYIGTTLFSEFDLVEVGDYAALNLGAVIQNHLFEDRVMKSSYLKIGAGCSVGNMAVVLYDSEMQDGSVLGPLSLLMKGEKLPRDERWLGIPCTREAPPVSGCSNAT